MKKTSKSTRGSRRSSGGSSPAGLAEILTALARVAKKARVPWYLFGAQAVALYGVPRTSADVDVTVWIGPDALPRFVAEMRAAGFQLRFDDPAFLAATRVLAFEHRRSGWPVDAVLGGPGLEELFLSRVSSRKVGRLVVPVLAPDDVIATKLLAGRPKDLEDVRGLLRAQPGLDLGRLEETIAALEEALDRRDLRPLLDSLRDEVGPSSE